LGKGIVIGLDKVLGKLDKLPKDIQKDVDNVMAEGVNNVVNLSRQLTPVGVGGKLRNSTTPEKLGEANYTITNNLFYAPYIEFGTGKKYQPQPGYEAQAAEARNLPKRGNFKEFVDSLTEWVTKKQITGTYSVKTRRRTGNKIKNQNEDAKFARFLAFKILKNGIKAQPFFFKSWELLKDDILSNIEKVVTKKR
jgi:hypothetical protein